MNLEKAFDLICFDVDGTLVKHPTGMVIWEVSAFPPGTEASVEQRHAAEVGSGRVPQNLRILPQLVRELILAQIHDNCCASLPSRNSKCRKTVKSVANDTLGG